MPSVEHPGDPCVKGYDGKERSFPQGSETVPDHAELLHESGMAAACGHPRLAALRRIRSNFIRPILVY